MKTRVVTVPTERIADWDSFHEVFADICGFPAFYGCNMNAWIDCMGYMDDPEAGMTEITVETGGLIVLDIADAPSFRRRCPDQYEALIECAAFVNYRRADVGDKPVIALLMSGWFTDPRLEDVTLG